MLSGMFDHVRRPHHVIASKPVLCVVPHADGYAVLTSAGIELRDASLAVTSTIPAAPGDELSSNAITPLADGRFLVHRSGNDSGGYLYEGTRETPLARVPDTTVTYAVVPTPDGYLAITHDKILVDRGGTKSLVEAGIGIGQRGAAWRDGAVVAGLDGLAIVGADGAVRARYSGSVRGVPIVVGDFIVIPNTESVLVLDGEAHLVASVPFTDSNTPVVPFRDGFMTCTYDDKGNSSVLSYYRPDGPLRAAEFDLEDEGHMQAPVVVGDRFVILGKEAGKDAARIYDASGELLAELKTSGTVVDVAAFGDGIAMSVRGADMLWWRAGQELVTLPHDATPYVVTTVPNGLVTTEGNVLYLWRADSDGPELPQVVTTLPMRTPIVIGGNTIEIVTAGRFALRAVTREGHTFRIEPDATYRPVTTREEAVRIIERLNARVFDRPLPEVPLEVIAGGVTYDVVRTMLTQLPLAETVDLHGRALFAPDTLNPTLRERSEWGRQSFFAELGAAVGKSGRTLLAAIKARKLELRPPRPMPDGYEYLGNFTTSGKLVVGDPCYVGRKAPGGFPLTLKVDGHGGVWHVFVKDAEGSSYRGTGELVMIHDDGFDVYANEAIGGVGVDSGTAGMFDAKCPKRGKDELWLDEGTVHGLGAVSSTGGDGMYPVYVGARAGTTAKVRIHYSGDGAADRSVSRAATPAKPYSIKTTFALGDTVEHVKFGIGSVTRAAYDKVDVSFAAGIKTLVHAKK